MKETDAESKRRRVELRKEVLRIIKKYQPITSYEIAQHLQTNSVRIASCCHGLWRRGFLKLGEPALSTRNHRKKAEGYIYTWMIDQAYNETANVPKNPVPITDEDLDWMRYWRKRHQAHYGHLRNIINDSLTI